MPENPERENERANLFQQEDQNSNEYSTVRERNGVVVAEDRELENDSPHTNTLLSIQSDTDGQ